MKFKTELLDQAAQKRALFRISHEIIEKNKGVDNLVLVGILTRGAPMAKIIGENIEKIEGVKVDIGSLDVTLYRDDLSEIDELPTATKISLGFDVKDKNVVLVDDVIFTGRTARAAIEAVLKIARPKTVQLAVLIDRGHRELPIRPDYVGKNIPTSLSEIVCVAFEETDEKNNVELWEKD